MWHSGATNNRPGGGLSRLYQRSIIRGLLHRILPFGRFRLNDYVEPLRFSPLYIFLYNQRVIFLGCALLFIAVLGVLTWALPSDRVMTLTVWVLATAWAANVVLTLVLHAILVKVVGRRVDASAIEVPAIFRGYFAIDCAVVLYAVSLGRYLGLNLDVLALLLIVNTLIFVGVYFFMGTRQRPLDAFLIVGIPLVGLYLSPGVGLRSVQTPLWFWLSLNTVPPVFASLMTIMSLVMVVRLRGTEQQITRKRLELLGEYENKLSEIPKPSASGAAGGREDEGAAYSPAGQFDPRVADVLKDLCSRGNPFWYRSACLWFLETHKDKGRVLLPGPAVNFEVTERHRGGVREPGGADTLSLRVLTSIKGHGEDALAAALNIPWGLDAPAAFVPLGEGNDVNGLLVLLGGEDEPLVLHEERTFLWALGSIISSAMEQWEGRSKTLLQSEMDELFACDELLEVFDRAARIMRQYLEAAGCLLIFRPDPGDKTMHIMAKIGFSDHIFKTNSYEVGKGLTGECAATGRVIRVDDVAAHRRKFENEQLDQLEVAHGGPILSYMAIPIGTRERNYGVIKVVNRTARCAWFRREDEQLGESLALRLKVIIERFLFVEAMIGAREEAEQLRLQAQRESERANEVAGRAELLAAQRQDDLMVVMHQLQGPLTSMYGSLSYLLSKETLPRDVRDELTNLGDFVSDSIALSYGTFTTFASEAGRQTWFGVHEINAPKELKRLAHRLQKTNARTDLQFHFYEEENFPPLQMDMKVFVSVFYSLIHNAMKYADPHSEVSLVCGTERRTHGPVLKVKSVGEPIQLSEREHIFEKFGRGRVVSSTGRHYSGAGLGLWVARHLMRAVGGDLTLELSAVNPRLSVFVVHPPAGRVEHAARAGSGEAT